MNAFETLSTYRVYCDDSVVFSSSFEGNNFSKARDVAWGMVARLESEGRKVVLTLTRPPEILHVTEKDIAA